MGHGVILVQIYLRKAYEMHCKATLIKCPYICSYSHNPSSPVTLTLCISKQHTDACLFSSPPTFLSRVTLETIGEPYLALHSYVIGTITRKQQKWKTKPCCLR